MPAGRDTILELRSGEGWEIAKLVTNVQRPTGLINSKENVTREHQEGEGERREVPDRERR